MKPLRLLFYAVTLLLLAACSQNLQSPTPNPDELAGLIAVEVAGIGSDDMSARAYGDPTWESAGLSAQAVTEARGVGPRDLKLLSLDTFTVGERGDGGLRYLSATFEVTNNTSKPLKNLTLLGVSTQNSQAGTPLRRVIQRRGAVAPDALVRSMKPIHGMRFDATERAPVVQNDMANFQAFTEDELPQKPFIRDNIQQYFPYGFAVEDSDPSDGSRELSPGEKGIVTFSYALPLQTRAVDDPVEFSVTFQAVDDDTVRVTETEKEQGKDSAEARARTLNAELALLGNADAPSSNLSVKRICVLRTAGTAEDPQAFLVNDTEGACVDAGQGPENPGVAPENPDGDRLFVDANAPEGGNGASWASAFKHLQDALKKGSDEGIFEIWLADGSYFPDRSDRGTVRRGNTFISFRPQGDFVLLGGFAGGETSAEARDFEKNVTVLSGDIDGQPDPFGNSQRVVQIPADASVVIDGVTVTQGRIGSTAPLRGGAGIANEGELHLLNSVVKDNHTESSFAVGGGIFNDAGATLTLVKTKVLNNSSLASGGGIADLGESLSLTDSEVSNNEGVKRRVLLDFTPSGGGLFHRSEGTVKIVRSTFSENKSGLAGGGISSIDGTFEIVDSFVLNNTAADDGGGGLYLENSSAEGVKITNTVVSDNVADSSGGGVLILTVGVEQGADLVAAIRDSTFSNNQGGSGGGLRSTQGLRITGSTFKGNRAGGDGGGVSLGSRSVFFISDSRITNNTAGRDGGGIRSQGNTSILRTTINDNTAPNRNGGGLAFENRSVETLRLVQSTLSGNKAQGEGGGLFLKVQEDNVSSGPRARVHNSLIVNNIAKRGGGIFHELGQAEVRNVTITGNVAQTGGGVLAKKRKSQATLFFLGNSIVTGNEASSPTSSGDLHGVRLDADDTAPVILVNRVLLGGVGNTGLRVSSTTLVDVNPQFVSPSTGDFGLQAGSPAVDKGSTFAMSRDELDTDGDGDTRELAPQDFAGNTRIVGGAVDMGAFEFQ